MATQSDGPSWLVRLLLAVLDGPTDAKAAERRLTELGLTPRPGLVEEVLSEAASMGLVRVASTGVDGPRLVRTSLGARLDAEVELPGDERMRLRDLESLRTDLSATIAHELRTPLTVIRTCVALLLSEDAHPSLEQRRTIAETIERNAERMQRIVGDILDLARFRAGSITLQARRFDADELATTAIASIEPMAAGRSVRIERQAAAERIAVFGDRRRLEGALINLLSNAVRFSPSPGRVLVSVSTHDGWVAWAVRDDGPGIAPADQALLFERFFVGRSDRAGGRDGVGLGLPTALAVANAHGGRIDVDSQLSAGSTFTLLVPIDGRDPATDPGLVG